MEELAGDLTNRKAIPKEDLLASKNVLLRPELLQQHGIPVCKVHQRPGEFIITFPQGFHAGFSTGFNLGGFVHSFLLHIEEVVYAHPNPSSSNPNRYPDPNSSAPL